MSPSGPAHWLPARWQTHSVQTVDCSSPPRSFSHVDYPSAVNIVFAPNWRDINVVLSGAARPRDDGKPSTMSSSACRQKRYFTVSSSDTEADRKKTDGWTGARTDSVDGVVCVRGRRSAASVRCITNAITICQSYARFHRRLPQDRLRRDTRSYVN